MKINFINKHIRLLLWIGLSITVGAIPLFVKGYYIERYDLNLWPDIMVQGQLYLMAVGLSGSALIYGVENRSNSVRILRLFVIGILFACLINFVFVEFENIEKIQIANQSLHYVRVESASNELDSFEYDSINSKPLLAFIVDSFLFGANDMEKWVCYSSIGLYFFAAVISGSLIKLTTEKDIIDA